VNRQINLLQRISLSFGTLIVIMVAVSIFCFAGLVYVSNRLQVQRDRQVQLATLTEKVKELVRLAHEQGQITFDDVNEILTEEFSTPAHLDHVFAKLRELEIEVVDAAEVDRVKPANADDADEDEVRLDALDDPVRMYLKQMGAVPLLTREQEVEISKRIEAAESELRKIVYPSASPPRNIWPWRRSCWPSRPANALTAWCWTKRWPAATPISSPCTASSAMCGNWTRTWTASTTAGATPIPL